MLIIYAHPNKTGHCGFILRELKKELDKKRRKYEVIDLYKIKYDPTLKPEEHYTSGHKEIAKETMKIQQKIKKSKKFVFIYPTWWNNPPAILKGFVDRVILPGFAFKYDKGIPHSLLKGKAAVFTTTGAPRIISKLYYKDNSLKFLTRDILKFCGIESKGFVIPNATRFTDKQKKKITKTVKKGLEYLTK